MRFQYLLEQAMINLRRNVLVVFAAVVAVLVMLTLVFGTIVLRWSIDQDIGRWDDNVRVIAFLSDDLSLEDVDSIPFFLEGIIEGVLGAIFAVALIWGVRGSIAELFSPSTEAGALVVPAEFMIRQALLVLGFGAGTGLLGSAFG